MRETPTLPGGTLTFLFADVESSTRLLESLGRVRYAELLGSLGGLLREAFEPAGGRQIETQGDAWFFVFESALEALVAAAAAQRAVAEREWRADVRLTVRIGVHTGEAKLAGERYFGLAVHRAARISGAAHGGQTVVSATTRDVAEDALPPGLELRHLGEHRLKDISRSERLFQLVVDGLPSEFPPLRAGEGQPETAFAGHEDELVAAVRSAMSVAPAVRAADADRDAAVAALREHTATGRLTLEEFSERVDEAYAARTHGELERVARELPVPSVPAQRRRVTRLTLSIFGHAVRRGLLRLRRLALALSVLGDIDLDLRGATLETEASTLLVFAFLGNVDVYVPEGADVETSGVALGGHCRDMGRIRQLGRTPQLRIRVLTFFGSADVWRVPPGARGTYGELIRQVKAAQEALPPPG